MKKYLSILIVWTLPLLAQTTDPIDVSKADKEPPPITTSPAYVPPKQSEVKKTSSRWKMATMVAITITGLALGLTMSGKDHEKQPSPPS